MGQLSNSALSAALLESATENIVIQLNGNKRKLVRSMKNPLRCPKCFTVLTLATEKIKICEIHKQNNVPNLNPINNTSPNLA